MSQYICHICKRSFKTENGLEWHLSHIHGSKNFQNKQRINVKSQIQESARPSDQVPECPRCGKPMVLKTARTGKYAGNKFYGCSGYPTCKHIIDADQIDHTPAFESETKLPSNNTTSETSLPKTLIARAKYRDYQVRFLETCVVPEELLDSIHSKETEESILKAFSQWRIDYPISESESPMDDGQRQILSVAEKILTRGKITP